MSRVKVGKFRIDTVVGVGKQNYEVSTIYRNSNILVATESCHFETLVFEVLDGFKKGKVVDDNSGAITVDGAIGQHLEMIKKYVDNLLEDNKE